MLCCNYRKEGTISIHGPPRGLGSKCSCPPCTLVVISCHRYHFLSISSPVARRATRPRAGLHGTAGSYRGLYLKVVTPLGHWKHLERQRLYVPSAGSVCSQLFHMASSSVALEKDSSNVSKCATLPMLVLYS